MSFVKRNQSLKYYEKEVSEDYFKIEKNIIFAGTHIILDLWNCSFSNKIAPLKKSLKKPVRLLGISITKLFNEVNMKEI